MGNLDNILVENTNNIVLILNSKAEIEYVSPSVKKVLGFLPEELLGNQWFVKTRTSVYERQLAKRNTEIELQEVLNKGLLPFEKSIYDSKGNLKHILWNTSKGPENSFIGVGIDITQRRNEEDTLKLKQVELAQKQKDIEESIQYASRLQANFLPDLTVLNESVNDAFVFYKPKDIVSGDFYSYFNTGDKLFFIVADCTGHGVPGAFLSTIGNTILKDLILRKRIYNPARILEELDKEFRFALEKPGKSDVSADGMDIGLISIDLKTQKLKYAGANRPLCIIRKGELTEIRADKFPIGFMNGIKKSYNTKVVELQEGDLLYLFSDGYTDQFGGDNIKKFNRKRFRKLLTSIIELPLDKQKNVLEESFNSWKGKEEQIDDVTVMGIKF